VPTDEERHRTLGVGAQCRLRRQHVRREAVVHEFDIADHTERATPARQPVEALGGGGQRVLVGSTGDAETLEDGARHGGIARVVRPGQAENRRPRGIAPHCGGIHPADVRAEERDIPVQFRVGIVSQGQGDSGFGAQ
jgi:hypothetical protein